MPCILREAVFWTPPALAGAGVSLVLGAFWALLVLDVFWLVLAGATLLAPVVLAGAAAWPAALPAEVVATGFELLVLDTGFPPLLTTIAIKTTTTRAITKLIRFLFLIRSEDFPLSWALDKRLCWDTPLPPIILSTTGENIKNQVNILLYSIVRTVTRSVQIFIIQTS
jgi:hypothetical protein